MARGQDNWQVWSILPLVDTFLNTAEKRPSFLGTCNFTVLGNVMRLTEGYLSTTASAIHLFPQQCPWLGICCIFHSVIT